MRGPRQVRQFGVFDPAAQTFEIHRLFDPVQQADGPGEVASASLPPPISIAMGSMPASGPAPHVHQSGGIECWRGRAEGDRRDITARKRRSASAGVRQSSAIQSIAGESCKAAESRRAHRKKAFFWAGKRSGSRRRRRVLPQDRQIEIEYRALARLIAYRAAMALDDGLGYAEAQSGTAFLPGVGGVGLREFLEHLVMKSCGIPWPLSRT